MWGPSLCVQLLTHREGPHYFYTYLAFIFQQCKLIYDTVICIKPALIQNIFIPTKKNNYLPYTFRKPALVLYTLLLLMVNLLFGAFGSGGPSEAAASAISASTLIAYTNQDRAANGLGTLTTNSILTAAAYAKGNDMLQKDYWAHFGPNGESPWQFIAGAGYAYIHAGENLAKGFSTSEGVHQAWMASPTHRANILSGNYTEIGIAVLEGTLQGSNTILVVQMFGMPVNAAPTNNIPSNSGSPVNNIAPSVRPIVERGDIKSISISYPEDGSTISTPQLEVQGSTEITATLEGSYTVEVYENQVKLSSADSESAEWVVTPPEPFSDGEHTLEASVEYLGRTHKSGVTFRVDTTPPVFNNELTIVSFVKDTEIWRIRTLVSEENVVVALLVDGITSPLQLMPDGFYQIEIGDQGIASANEVKIVLTDKVGNSANYSIKNRFIKPEEKDNLQAVGSIAQQGDGSSRYLGTLSVLNNIDVRAKANIAFVTVIFILLLIQVVAYRELGMLDKKGGYLFTLGAWVFILFLLTTVGSVGELV